MESERSVNGDVQMLKFKTKIGVTCKKLKIFNTVLQNLVVRQLVACMLW